jgi:hypothetical protein
VNRAWSYSLRRPYRADHGTPVIEDLYEALVAYSSYCCVGRVHAQNPVIVAIDQKAMFLDIVYPAVLAITHRMETISGVRRDKLQRVLCKQIGGMVSFPGWDVLTDYRPLRIMRIESAKARREEFKFSGLRL